MIIRKASKQDITTIHTLANEIWWPTYQSFLSKEQISFMLNKSYSEAALEEQMNENVIFLVGERNDTAVAFAGYLLNLTNRICNLHKLYILPSEQGKGTGKTLINHIMGISQEAGANTLELNVNRNNPALGFYKALGFEIIQEMDIPYYGFVLNDFVLRKRVG